MDGNSKQVYKGSVQQICLCAASFQLHVLPAELTRSALEIHFFSFSLLLSSLNFRICCQMLIHARAG